MRVSMVVPARRWDHHLENTLASIEAQELPDGVEVEAVVALAEGERPEGSRPGVRVVVNPTGTIPAGLNLAIGASTGDIVARVDARSLLPPTHVAGVVRGLGDPAIGCVGGAALALDRGLFGSTYAVAFNSVLLGPTVYRYRRTSGPADAVYLGAWRRTDLDRLGGFDERMVRNQDNELSDRVAASGLAVWYDAELVIGYHNDRDLRSALAHHHEFGLWRMVQRSQGQRALTPRHVAALAMLGGVGLAGGWAASRPRARRWLVAADAGAYAAAAGAAWRSAATLRRARPDIDGPPFHPAASVLAPALAVLLDGAWLGGLLRGAVRSRRRSA